MRTFAETSSHMIGATINQRGNKKQLREKIAAIRHQSTDDTDDILTNLFPKDAFPSRRGSRWRPNWRKLIQGFERKPIRGIRNLAGISPASRSNRSMPLQLIFKPVFPRPLSLIPPPVQRATTYNPRTTIITIVMKERTKKR